MTVVVQRLIDRAVSRGPGLVRRHGFDSGPHWSPAGSSHGALVAHDHDVLAPGAGFAEHQHADVEIVAWVLSGQVVHRDLRGNRVVARPGRALRISAGSGLRHTEANEGDEPAEVLQSWVLPRVGGTPDVASVEVDLLSGSLVTVVSGLPRHVTTLQTHGAPHAPATLRAPAALHAAVLAPGHVIGLPDAPRLHVYVARGGAELSGAGVPAGEVLAAGDGARTTGEHGLHLTSTGHTEVLVWELHPPSDDDPGGPA